MNEKRKLKKWVWAVIIAMTPVILIGYTKFIHQAIAFFYPNLGTLEVVFIIFIAFFSISMIAFALTDVDEDEGW